MLLFLFWYSDLALLQFELHTVHLPGSLDAQDASMQFVILHTGIFRWQRPTTPGIAGMSGVVPLQFSPSTYPLKTLNFLLIRLIIKVLTTLAEACELLVSALTQGNKILLFGNGGSAADA